MTNLPRRSRHRYPHLRWRTQELGRWGARGRIELTEGERGSTGEQGCHRACARVQEPVWGWQSKQQSGNKNEGELRERRTTVTLRESVPCAAGPSGRDGRPLYIIIELEKARNCSARCSCPHKLENAFVVAVSTRSLADNATNRSCPTNYTRSVSSQPRAKWNLFVRWKIKQSGKEQHSIGMHNSTGGYYTRFKAQKHVKMRARKYSTRTYRWGT
jgi:hypothetical protein